VTHFKPWYENGVEIEGEEVIDDGEAEDWSDAGEVLSEFLCVCCEHGVPTPTEESHNNVQY
jgi:hypothetical protein